VGGGNPELGTLMARCNRAALLTALAAYRQQLEALEQQVSQENWQCLRQKLDRSQELRPQFL
jgi:arogenate dehydrogenase (NADP+)